MLGFGLLILCFQNCSDMVMQDSVMYQASLAEYEAAADKEYLPALLTTSSLSFWSKPSDVNYVNKSSVLSDSFSFVAALSRSARGVVMSVNSGTGLEEGRITVTDSTITAARYIDANNYSYIEVPLPSSGEQMVIGASFAQTAGDGDVTLMINGILQIATRLKVGVPGDFSYVLKSLTTAPSTGIVSEYVVYNTPLNATQLNVMSRYIASAESIQNVVYDPVLMNGDGSGASTTTEDPLFVAAKTIIDNKCIVCHVPNSNGGDLTNLTSAKAVSRGWVVAGNPASSKLYYRLQGSSGSGTKDMPQAGSITATEVQAIADWISNIK